MTQTQDMEWAVKFSPKVDKQKATLPANIDDRLAFLVREGKYDY